MAATIQNNRWVREPDDFAVVLREKQISDFFAAWIAIEDGTTGLLLIHGRYDKRLDPGQHTIEGFMGGHGRKTLVLVNMGEVMLHKQNFMGGDTNFGLKMTLYPQFFIKPGDHRLTKNAPGFGKCT